MQTIKILKDASKNQACDKKEQELTKRRVELFSKRIRVEVWQDGVIWIDDESETGLFQSVDSWDQALSVMGHLYKIKQLSGWVK